MFKRKEIILGEEKKTKKQIKQEEYEARIKLRQEENAKEVAKEKLKELKEKNTRDQSHVNKHREEFKQIIRDSGSLYENGTLITFKQHANTNDEDSPIVSFYGVVENAKMAMKETSWHTQHKSMDCCWYEKPFAYYEVKLVELTFKIVDGKDELSEIKTTQEARRVLIEDAVKIERN